MSPPDMATDRMSARPILIGASCAAVGQFLALGVAGAGHGWVAPFFYSPLLFVAYPLVLARLADRNRRTRWIEVALLTVAIAADWGLASNALGPEAIYVTRVLAAAPIFLVSWLFLWSGWQILALWLLLHSFRGAKDG